MARAPHRRNRRLWRALHRLSLVTAVALALVLGWPRPADADPVPLPQPAVIALGWEHQNRTVVVPVGSGITVSLRTSDSNVRWWAAPASDNPGVVAGLGSWWWWNGDAAGFFLAHQPGTATLVSANVCRIGPCTAIYRRWQVTIVVASPPAEGT